MISSFIQHNRDRDLSGNIREFSSVLKLKGLEELKNEMTIESQGDGVADSFFRIFTADGREIFSSDMTAWPNVKVSPQAIEKCAHGSVHVFETLEITGQEHKARSVYGNIGQRIIMQIGETMEDDETSLRIFKTVFGIGIILLIPFATGTGWLMGRHALQGVEKVTKTALSISQGDFEQRVSVNTKAEEITRLASAFNFMLDRIDLLVSSIRNMMDDITHDLKKPIARIRVIAEKNLFTGKPDNQYDSYAARILEECDYLMQMINTMLDISEAESGATKLQLENLDVAEIALKAYDLFYPIAEDKHLNFIMDSSGPCCMRGDVQKIQRMIANLLDNALKYTSPGGEIIISTDRDNEHVKVAIKDSGCGISGEDLSHVFERFYRCDKSRSQTGAGLGLTLARAIAMSHGGDITVSSCLGRGSTFTVYLPIS